MSHTPGPWKFHDEDFKVRGTGDIEGMTVIANLSPTMDYSRGKNTQWANGQLIAAAPELLNALIRLLKASRQMSFELTGSIDDTPSESAAEEAINKATV